MVAALVKKAEKQKVKEKNYSCTSVNETICPCSQWFLKPTIQDNLEQ